MQPDLHEHRPRKMLRTAEAAQYCGSSASTLSKLRLFGGGPIFVKIGRRVVYYPEDLDRWLAAHRRSSTSERALASPPCRTTSDAQVTGDHGGGEVAPVPRSGRPRKRLQTANPVVAS
jgi:predicted DNA-binding transcriptional regulator AlpA